MDDNADLRELYANHFPLQEYDLAAFREDAFDYERFNSYNQRTRDEILNNIVLTRVPSAKDKAFIERSSREHPGKYLYFLVRYVASNKKVWLICPRHGCFQTRPDLHYAGKKSGCYKCGADTRTKEEFVYDGIVKFAGKYTYYNTVIERMDVKCTITCTIDNHGDFLIQPRCHLQTTGGCPKCSGVCKNNQAAIEKFTAIHGDLYDYRFMEYQNNDVRILVLCKRCNRVFSIRPRSHLTQGCRHCAKFRKTDCDEKIDRLRQVYQGTYSYDGVLYCGLNGIIDVHCNYCDRNFKIRYSDHLRGVGCENCGGDPRGKEYFMRIANHTHRNRYSYDNFIYRHRLAKSFVTCPDHGDFLISANLHMDGYGCGQCDLCPTCKNCNTGGIICEYCNTPECDKLRENSKEGVVVKFLRENLSVSFLHNKEISHEITGKRYRPDILINGEHCNIIVEVDENQHRGGGYKCDHRRMYDIIAEIGPTIFIRYNPDHEASDIHVLLKMINIVMDNITECETMMNEHCLGIIYLYYSKIKNIPYVQLNQLDEYTYILDKSSPIIDKWFDGDESISIDVCDNTFIMEKPLCNTISQSIDDGIVNSISVDEKIVSAAEGIDNSIDTNMISSTIEPLAAVDSIRDQLIEGVDSGTIIELIKCGFDLDTFIKTVNKYRENLEYEIERLGRADSQINQSRMMHPGNDFDYTLTRIFFLNNFFKTPIRCLRNPEHGIFLMKMNNHVSNGQKCPKCRVRKTSVEKHKAVIIHNLSHVGKLDYNPNDNTMRFTCNHCNLSLVKEVGKMTRLKSCPFCNGQIVDDVTIRHFTRLRYDDVYSIVEDYKYVGADVRVPVRCNRDNVIFNVIMRRFLRGEECCPKCKYRGNSSGAGSSDAL